MTDKYKTFDNIPLEYGYDHKHHPKHRKEVRWNYGDTVVIRFNLVEEFIRCGLIDEEFDYLDPTFLSGKEICVYFYDFRYDDLIKYTFVYDDGEVYFDDERIDVFVNIDNLTSRDYFHKGNYTCKLTMEDHITKEEEEIAKEKMTLLPQGEYLIRVV